MQVDQNLFCKVLPNPDRVLHGLLLPVSTSVQHSLPLCAVILFDHTYTTMPGRLSHLVDCSFVIHLLFHQAY